MVTDTSGGLGQRIKHLLAEHGRTMSWLASQRGIGVSHSTLSRWLQQDDPQIPFGTLIAMANALQADPCELMGIPAARQERNGPKTARELAEEIRKTAEQLRAMLDVI